VPSELSMYYFM